MSVTPRSSVGKKDAYIILYTWRSLIHEGDAAHVFLETVSSASPSSRRAERADGAWAAAGILDLAHALQPQVDVGAPAVEALDGDAAAKVLGIGAAQGQAVAQAGDGAAAAAGGGDD